MQAIKLAGTRAELAALFGRSKGGPLSRQTIEQWCKRGKIPPARILELMDVRPEWFKKTNGAKP